MKDEFSVFRSEEEELKRFYRKGAKVAKGRRAGVVFEKWLVPG